MDEQNGGQQGPECHILFVEDNYDTGQLVSLVLSSQGYNVTCVPTIQEAMELIKATKFNLYLLDNRLPDGEGVELCKQIREDDGQTPILFFSAAAYERDKIRAIEAGADGYVTKPINPQFLIENVRRLLGDSCLESFRLWS